MRAIVRILHKFSIENGQAVDKQTIQNAYRKHPMKNSLRCISDVLDEIGISHQVYPLESCSDQELKGKILYIPIEHNPIWLVSFQNSNNLTLSDGNIKKSITLKNLKMDTPIYVVHTKRTATDIKGQRNISYYFRNLIWDLGFYGLSALIFLSLFSLIFVNFCSFTTFLLRLCLFCGIVVSSSITIKKFTEFSSTKGLCNIIRTSGCKDVIDKNNSLLFGQIPIGDIALAYFLIEFVLSLSCPDDSVFSTFFYISCLTIPIVVYSVIWQIKRRTFCIKCLFTDLLLVVEFLLLFAVNTWNANVRYILYFLLGCLSILLTITILRDNSLNEITYKRLVHKEESILSNPNLLTNLLQSEIQIIRRDDLDFPTINNGLQEYNHWLLVGINPYCSHCQELVKELNSLESIRVDIVFIVYDKKDIYTASWILEEYYETESSCNIYFVLNRWFSAKKLPASWKSKEEYVRIALLHSNFAKKMQITETPFICIDGKLLPEVYDYTELKFLF